MINKPYQLVKRELTRASKARFKLRATAVLKCFETTLNLKVKITVAGLVSANMITRRL